MTAPDPVVREFKAYERNTLRGFFDLELASGMILAGCTLHLKNDQWWSACHPSPTRPRTARNRG